MSVVERTYGQWMPVSTECAEQSPETAHAAVIAQLDRWLEESHLRPVSSPLVHCAASLWSEPLSVFVAERRATGLPPEERLPQGWRRWFCAP